MSEKSKIQWTDDTWNPWRGCVKVSPGCANCYAEVSTPVRVARSEGRELWGGKLRDKAKDFEAPLKWNKKPWVCDACGTARDLVYASRTVPDVAHDYCDKCGDSFASFHRRRVFSLSLGDWLDPDVPIEWLAEMLDVIRRCPNLDFLLLTKRPENWLKRTDEAKRLSYYAGNEELAFWLLEWNESENPPANVWIGCTVENQEYADKRIPELLMIPAVCRFLSVEPMLENIRLKIPCGMCGCVPEVDGCGCERCVGGERKNEHQHDLIHWVIVGGESGPKARLFNVEWARAIVAQCKAAGVAVFCKQLGANPFEESDYMPSDSNTVERGAKFIQLKDKKGGSMEEWPVGLRVREFPKIKPA